MEGPADELVAVYHAQGDGDCLLFIFGSK
jgi:hypothetical protein